MTASVPIRASVIQALLDIAGGSIYDNAWPREGSGQARAKMSANSFMTHHKRQAQIVPS
jgi:hypothetical protein